MLHRSHDLFSVLLGKDFWPSTSKLPALVRAPPVSLKEAKAIAEAERNRNHVSMCSRCLVLREALRGGFENVGLSAGAAFDVRFLERLSVYRGLQVLFCCQESPFVQCHLPEGFKYQGRKSKSLSFQEAAQIVTQRGTVRTKEAATTGVQAWAWQWYGSLTAIQKAALTETSHVAERPPKKARVASAGFICAVWDSGRCQNIEPYSILFGECRLVATSLRHAQTCALGIFGDYNG